MKTHSNGILGERILSGNTLKYCAAFLMLLDHLSDYIFPDAFWMNWLGRLVAPIFIYMTAEGFYYTHDRGKYILRLFIGFEFMAVCNMILSHAADYNVSVGNNIFGTMLWITLLLWCFDTFISGARKKDVKRAALGAALLLGSIAISYVINLWIQSYQGSIILAPFAVPCLFEVEGGYMFVLLGIGFYFLRRNRYAQMLPILVFSAYWAYMAARTSFSENTQWLMIFTVIPLLMYSGKRGKGVSPSFDKWFFYIFYPAHIYLLFFIAWIRL